MFRQPCKFTGDRLTLRQNYGLRVMQLVISQMGSYLENNVNEGGPFLVVDTLGP